MRFKGNVGATVAALGVAALFGLLFWVADSVYEYYCFDSNLRSMLFQQPLTFLDALERNVPSHSLFSRLAFLSACLVGGTLVAFYLRLLRERDDALRKSEEWLSTTLRCIGDAVITTDTDHRVIFMNPVAERLSGWTLAEVKGRRLDDFLALIEENSRERVGSPVETALREGRHATLPSLTLLIAKDGREVPIDDSAAPIVGSNGEIRGAALVFHDISVRRDAERALLGAKEAAVKADFQKSKFIANMSHEIRTPMNAIIAMTDFVLKTELAPKQREYLSIIRESERGLMTIVNEILDLAKINSGKLKIDAVPFNLRPLAERVVTMSSLKCAEKGIRLDFDYDDRVPACLLGDSLRLTQVLSNLMDNAVKFTSAGHVRLKITSEGQSGETNALRFEISDTGIGISPEQQRSIFDAFTQADASISRNFGGTGLGLPICAHLVGLMGGRVEVSSQLGKGSVFTVLLKLDAFAAQAEETPPTKPAAAPPPAPRTKRRLDILVVEDSDTNQSIIRLLLEDEGHAVSIADNGRKALKDIESKRFDLVLMDIQMPEMNGFEATAAIRSREAGSGAHIPIIAMTAYAMEGDAQKCLACGMDDYVSKPIDMALLFEKINHWGAK